MYRQISPKTARRYLRTIEDPQQCFFTKDGQRICSLYDLYAHLKSCGYMDFRAHVSGSQNDFADWINDVIRDEELAGMLDRCVMRQPMQHRLLMRINHLASNASREMSGREKAIVILEDVQAPEELFITADGRTLRNLWELYAFLKETDYPTIMKHVSEGRNDIADWVDDVVLDYELADRLRAYGDHFGMMFVTAWRLKQLEKHMPSIENPQEFYVQAVNAVKS